MTALLSLLRGGISFIWRRLVGNRGYWKLFTKYKEIQEERENTKLSQARKGISNIGSFASLDSSTMIAIVAVGMLLIFFLISMFETVANFPLVNQGL